MIRFQSILSAIKEFLNEAKSIGIVTEFSLTLAESSNEKVPDVNLLISKLQNAINTPVDQVITDTSEKMETVEDTSVDQSHSESCTESNEQHPEQKNLVQIQVDENEMKRRISAFISRKRKEVDEWNVQEFCSRPYIEEQNPMWEEIDSCARTDTVFVPRSGSKSHVKVSKVENRWGPQTNLRSVEGKQIKKEPVDETENPQIHTLQAIEERLQNMEYHLKLKTESSRTNIFQRLKQLEDRILFLEGISPDYFNLPGTDFQSPRKKFHFTERQKMYSSWSMDDVCKRIHSLKESLKTKEIRIKKEPVS